MNRGVLVSIGLGLWVLCTFVACGKKKESGKSSPKDPSEKSLSDIVAGSLIDGSGTAIKNPGLENKEYVLLYFSAHWCPPCRAFTPQLVEFYNANKSGDNFEIIFVSADRTEQEMMNYMKEMSMPWPAIEFNSSKRDELRKTWAGPGIPCLVMLDKDSEVVSDSFDGKTYLGPHKVLEDLREELPLIGKSAKGGGAIEEEQEQESDTDAEIKRMYTLDGIITGKKEPVALINHKPVSVGDTLEGGAKVVEITKTYAVIEFEGKTYQLRRK